METEEDAKNEGTNLFVTGLSKAVTEPELAEVFSKYGVVDKCQIMVDPHTKESRGFGFVNMLDVAGADGAISSLNGFLLAGRTLSIEKAKRKRPRTPTPGKYFGPSKARRGRPRFDDRYRDRRYYGGGRRYDDRPRYDDPYRRPRFEERDEYRDRYYRDRGRERIDRGERYSGPRYEDRERYSREYREPYDRRYSREERLPIRDHRDERYRDDRDRYPAPLPPSDGYREREDYRP
ncbi:hypothetical protein D0Z00_001965 [Geotrichum galactomycetum]|uniref:Uncharacterized protein n=1 Tax=Geotrichum galactomycetum TaxID=27317 RepID=A0ACB6V5J4_9ASCO|nr:hypothetical protein D0Z00_001965 [Geotrichum candidum]